jgi:hypothetical protein
LPPPTRDHADEAHEYNKRLKGREDERDPDWAISDFDNAVVRMTYWPRSQERQVAKAWSIANRLAEMYERIGQRSAEAPQQKWYGYIAEAKPKYREIIGTTAPGS